MQSFTALSLEEYLEKLSSAEPVPGGGSVSAYVASLAMGLTQMVGRITLGRKKKQGLSPEEEKREEERRGNIQKIIDFLEKVKEQAFQIVDLDPQIYQEVMSAWGDEQKMEDTLQNSFRLQADLALLIVMAHEWNANLAGMVKGSIKNDLLVAAGLYEGSFKGACDTAMINVKYMKDETRKAAAEKALQDLKKRFSTGADANDQSAS
ncbi:MAG: cyclodeaminase/cyclohydrolase family protein [Candidatus Omnitrophica bacterium]|nr:cyclodeaminase/cyclohydrolase family protein [Candidatus Omnitrophota bacterium]